jgi:hypothetical protein
LEFLEMKIATSLYLIFIMDPLGIT